MRKNNKKFYYIGALVLILILVVFGTLFYVSNSKNNYSFSEKNWINSNTDKEQAVIVQRDLPIFSNNGEGVFYDFLNSLEKDTNLSFIVNVSDGTDNSGYIFKNKNVIDKNDLVFYTDHYILISTNNNYVSDLSQIKNQVIGVIDGDKDYVSDYLKDYGLNFKSYDSFGSLIKDMNETIIYAIIPMDKYINEIVYNKYNIVHHIEGLHSHYVLSMSDSESVLSSVFKKFYNKWEDEVYTSINGHFLNLYYNANNLSELEKVSITGDDLIVGYIDNMPLEGKVGNKFSGLTDEYLSLFADMTGATYKYIKYDNVEKLTKALNEKKIDIVMNYYNLSNNNYAASVSLGNIPYVVVTHQDNVVSIENLDTLKDDSVKMVANSKLYSFIRSKNITTQVYSSYDSLFKEMSKDDILVMEKTTYDYYKNSKLSKYLIKFLDSASESNSFLINKDNTVFLDIFNFYLSTLGSVSVNNMAIRDSLEDASTSMFIHFLFNNITYILALIFAVAFFLFKFQKRVKVTKKIKKEDKMMYLDVMTNLKNRNYLNDNLAYWEANKIYPQAIVVVDLNDIAVINDTKGHEEGDKQIKSAAGILIKTQRENSEIIRTDGNEFLIYLVGYEEKQIVTYVNKLYKELKELPYEYGASVGYSMITTESVTIDDAINEALSMMRKNKGE